MFKYLNRDGDSKMTLIDLIIREFKEEISELKKAKKKFRGETYKQFAYWIRRYHKGMFFKPFCKNNINTITLNDINSMSINFRENQSDLLVLQEIFISDTYNYFYEKYIDNVKIIFDLGANIGLSALYFQNRFKKSKIYCVEPSKENIDVLKLNNKKNNFDWEIIEGAIQDSDGKTVLYPNEWWSSATTKKSIAKHRENIDVRPEKIYKKPPQEVDAFSIDTLLDKYKIDIVDIIKMDIEGAEESVIFAENKWMRKVKILVIEIHDKYIERKKIENKLFDNGFIRPIDNDKNKDVFFNTDIFINTNLIKIIDDK